MIRYEKCGLDENVIRLLGKLGENFVLASMIRSIEDFDLTVNKVFYDDKLYGILILRASINRRGELVLVVEHAIAEDKIEVHFKNILMQSFAQHVKQYGFKIVRIHANRPGMKRILERIMGPPKEYVFSVEIDTWIHQANLQQASQLQAQQQMPE